MSKTETTRRNEQTKISLGVSIAKQHAMMERLLKRATERVKKMTPEELEEMYKAQRKSWTEQDRD